MKKGIVMEQHRKFTIVMTTDGLIEKAHPIGDADIGFEVDYEPLVQNQWRSIFKQKFFTMRVAALACVFLIALLPFYMVTNGSETYAYVDIDINPSMELEIDNDLEVSDIKPFNDDAKLILDQIGELEGKNVEDAIEIIINTSEEEGLINTAKNVLIGVHYLKDEEKDPIIKTIEDHFDKKTTDWEVVTVVIPDEVRDTAEKNNKSMNETLANTVTEQTDKQEEAIMTEKDKEVVQSFFNKDKTEVEITTDDSTEKRMPMPTMTTEQKDNEKGKSFKDETHPSELKAKNGEINSNKNKNGHQNGKANGHHRDIHQEKFNNSNNNNNSKANNGNGNKNIDTAKQKDKHKENYRKDKQKGNEKGNNGNGNNGKNNGNNGKGHENRGNNGNGNNKDDGYSYSFPLFK